MDAEGTRGGIAVICRGSYAVDVIIKSRNYVLCK